MVQGWLDRLDFSIEKGWSLQGWAADLDHPQRRLVVQVHHRDLLVVEISADNPRGDLLDGRIGDGCYGFEAPIPGTLLADVDEVAFSLWSDGRCLVPSESFKVSLIVGCLEHVSGMVVTGWALNPTNMLTPLCLDMVVDGLITDRMVADRYREDVALGGSRCGFSWLIPEPFIDGLSHALIVSLTNRPDMVLEQTKQFRFRSTQLSSRTRRLLAMRRAAEAQMRSCEQALFSEGAALSGESSVTETIAMLQVLRQEPDVDAAARDRCLPPEEA